MNIHKKDVLDNFQAIRKIIKQFFQKIGKTSNIMKQKQMKSTYNLKH